MPAGPVRMRRREHWYAALVLGSVVAFWGATKARAEAPPPRQVTVPSPGRSIAANDESNAISTNPANLGFLPEPELRWTWVQTQAGSTGDPGSPDPGRGHALDFAFRLFGRLGTGLRLDFVRPGVSVPAPYDHTYNWLTWALALRANDALSLGFSIAHAYSEDERLAGPTSLNGAISVRPSPYLGVAFVGRNLNSPRSMAGIEVSPEATIAVAVRPTGKRDLEIGLEDTYIDASGQWLPRATLGVDVPYVGRVRGDVATSDPTMPGTLVYTATAGLEVNWNSGGAIGSSTISAEGGAVFGSMVGGSRGAGFYTGVAISGSRKPGLPEPGYALKIRIEETPGARAHVHLLQKLWKLAADPDLRAVAFVLKTEPASSLVHAEELGDAVRMLRANGKKVICHLEDAQGRGLYLCSQADRVVMHPAGLIRFAGLKSQYMYFGALAEKLGVQVQIVRIGAHKTAPEQYTRTGASDVARADHLDILNETNQVFLSDVGGGRKIPMATLSETLSHGPFIVSEAKAAGLVDGPAFDDELDSVVSETVGERVSLRDEPRPPRVPDRFGTRRGLAIVYVEGDMIDGRSRDIPILGNRLVGSYTVAQALKQAREDPNISAVVMRLETPGGSSVAADVIWREARLLAKVKPLVVSMGTYAASAGYYIATAGHTVWANPLSITGSIGIFFGKADLSSLLQKIGVNVETYKTTPRADGDSMFRPYTPAELFELERKVGQLYDLFLDRVAEGRHLTKANVDAVGQGRVWTGREALDRKLVDRLGGIREAVEQARKIAGLPSDAPVEELPVPQTSLLEFAAKLAGLEANVPEAAALTPAQIVDLLRAMAPFLVYESDEPLARLEMAPLSQP